MIPFWFSHKYFYSFCVFHYVVSMNINIFLFLYVSSRLLEDVNCCECFIVSWTKFWLQLSTYDILRKDFYQMWRVKHIIIWQRLLIVTFAPEINAMKLLLEHVKHNLSTKISDFSSKKKTFVNTVIMIEPFNN